MERNPFKRTSGLGNIYVKQLHPSINTAGLRALFQEFGAIASCKVVLDKSGTSKGYGFVQFEDASSASTAIAARNGFLHMGQQLFVGPFQRAKRHAQSGGGWTNCYVKHLPPSWTADKLRTVFETIGPVASASVETTADGKSKCFGYVNFCKHADALRAVAQLHRRPIADFHQADSADTPAPPDAPAAEATTTKPAPTATPVVASRGTPEPRTRAASRRGRRGAGGRTASPRPTTLHVCRHLSRREREARVAASRLKRHQERQSRGLDLNVYVKNLHPSVDDAWLRREFGALGTITSCRVMRYEDGSSKVRTDLRCACGAHPCAPGFTCTRCLLCYAQGFGFVCFSTPEEASQAISAMNGRPCKGKPLYVALAQPKELRVAAVRASLHRWQMPATASAMPHPSARHASGGGLWYASRPQAHAAYTGAPAAQAYNVGMGYAGYGSRPYMPMAAPYGYAMHPSMHGRAAPAPTTAAVSTATTTAPLLPPPPTSSVATNGAAAPAAPPRLPSAELTAGASTVAPQAAGAGWQEQAGNKLFPHVEAIDAKRAGKLTGMLLSMGPALVDALLSSPALIPGKVLEAQAVLDAAATA